MKSIVFSVFLLISALCWGETPTSKPLSFPLRYSKPLAKQGFASPLVTLTINKKSGTFLVDSGASIHVVADWFAAKAGLGAAAAPQEAPADEASSVIGDSSGAAGGGQIISVELALRGSKLSFKNQMAVITPFPDVFAQNQIAGILSPQQLVTETELGVLHLKKPLFEILPIAAFPESAKIPLRASISTGPEGTTSILYIMNTEVEGNPTSFIVDTGADGAGIGMETNTGGKLLPRSRKSKEKIGGISGEPQEVRVLQKASVKVLDQKHSMNIRLQPTSHKMPADGMMGMKFLKPCTLYMTWANGALDCGPPSRGRSGKR